MAYLSHLYPIFMILKVLITVINGNLTADYTMTNNISNYNVTDNNSYAYKYMNHLVVVVINITNTKLNIGLDSIIAFVPEGYRPRQLKGSIMCCLKWANSSRDIRTFHGDLYMNTSGHVTQNISTNFATGVDIFGVFMYVV